ncbi:MAG: hypothetical protein GC155_11440 [Alphaproteobacteria bacterium]|nr:hypothetical protein [Alphaproteobacteria bacterium]
MTHSTSAMRLRLLSAAAIAVALGLSAGTAAAQTRASTPGSNSFLAKIPKPGDVDVTEMERRWGGVAHSGVTVAGPETDQAAINAPTVEAGYKVPRHADGTPDLTGVWSNASNTTLRRPGNAKNLVMTDEQALKAREDNPQNIRQATDDRQKTSDGLLTGKDLAAGRGYNSFWIDPGNNYALVKGTWRTSWIVDPPNGQMPLKPGAMRPRRVGTGYDNPEERNLNERCLILGTSGPPIGNYLYNNNTRIMQSPNAVVIESEMIHDARIIPLVKTAADAAAKHRPAALDQWMGDSVGWYEGDTLVVETTNMMRGGGSAPMSPTGKIIERFTRYNDKQVFYEFEVNDPNMYTQVWKGQMSLNASPALYEYACHEGNYAMHGILAAGRKNDREGIKNDSSTDGTE